MKTKIVKNVLFISVLLLTFTVAAQAQIKMPQASPSSSVSQQVGLTTIDLNYSRPSKRERKIFGELVPYGSIWRTGANNPTTLQFDTPFKVEGKSLPAGKYAIYAIPEKKEWTIIFSKKTDNWGAMGYDEKDDAVRFTVPTTRTKNTVETMKVSFQDITDTGSTVEIAWDNTAARFRVETEVDPIVMKQIKEMLIDKDSDNPMLYFQAANYYFSNNKDLKTAMEWIEKSVEGDPRYYTVHLKAKIEAALGMKADAISTAQQSMEMAREANNPDYIALNERLIASLK
jgi:hypothetical protein